MNTITSYKYEHNAIFFRLIFFSFFHRLSDFVYVVFYIPMLLFFFLSLFSSIISFSFAAAVVVTFLFSRRKLIRTRFYVINLETRTTKSNWNVRWYTHTHTNSQTQPVARRIREMFIINVWHKCILDLFSCYVIVHTSCMRCNKRKKEKNNTEYYSKSVEACARASHTMQNDCIFFFNCCCCGCYYSLKERISIGVTLFYTILHRETERTEKKKHRVIGDCSCLFISWFAKEALVHHILS